jgi:hypothetical protein
VYQNLFLKAILAKPLGAPGIAAEILLATGGRKKIGAESPARAGGAGAPLVYDLPSAAKPMGCSGNPFL